MQIEIETYDLNNFSDAGSVARRPHDAFLFKSYVDSTQLFRLNFIDVWLELGACL